MTTQRMLGFTVSSVHFITYVACVQICVHFSVWESHLSGWRLEIGDCDAQYKGFSQRWGTVNGDIDGQLLTLKVHANNWETRTQVQSHIRFSLLVLPDVYIIPFEWLNKAILCFNVHGQCCLLW